MLVTYCATHAMGEKRLFAFFVVVIAIVRLCSGSLNRVLHNTEREV